MLKIKLKIINYWHNKYQKNKQTKIFITSYKTNLTSTIISYFFKATILVFFGIIVLLPFYFMLNVALQSNSEAIGGEFVYFPAKLQWNNFSKAFSSGYWQALLITFTVTAISIVARTFFSMLVGYAFSIKKWKLKNLFWWFLLSLLVLPEVGLLLGQYKVIVALNWRQSGWIIAGMFMPFVASTFSAFMYRNSFLAIPDRIKEAAMIDGVGSIRFFFKVAIPMVKSTTLTVLILTAFAAWNSFTWPQLLLSGQTNPNLRFEVLTTWLYTVGTDNTNPDNTIVYSNIRMAGAIITILPMFVMYFVFRKKIMNAISRQGSTIKG